MILSRGVSLEWQTFVSEGMCVEEVNGSYSDEELDFKHQKLIEIMELLICFYSKGKKTILTE